MAVQVLCLACGVNIEAAESPNWEVVPCFRCSAPLRMPVAVQKNGSGPPSNLDSKQDPFPSKSIFDPPDDIAQSTPVVPNKPSKPIPPVKAQVIEPPPLVPASPVPVRAGLEHSPTAVSPPRVELTPSSGGSAYSGPVSTTVEVNKSASESFDEPVEGRSDKKGSSVDSGRGTTYKLMLALGYIVFVVIPLGGVIVLGVDYIKRMDEVKTPPDAAQMTPEEPVDRKNKPEPKQVTVGMLPPEGFTSEWEKVGPVEVRIAGAAIRHVPILNAERHLADSPTPVLAIWVETRVTTADKTIEVRRWQTPSEGSCRLTTDEDEELHRAQLGPGAILRVSIPSKQPLSLNSRPHLELLIFTPPPGGVKSVTLTLDAALVGEVGSFNLTIPVPAWKSKNP